MMSLRSIRFYFLLSFFLPGFLLAQSDTAVTDTLVRDTIAYDTIMEVEIPDEYTEGDLSLATPRGAVLRHLLFLQAETFNPDSAALSLYSEELNRTDSRQRAIMLKQIFDAKGDYISIDNIPATRDYTDSTSGRARYIPVKRYPEIYLERYDEEWKYSRESVRRIPEIHDKVFALGSEVFVQLTPRYANREFLGLKVWQWEGLIITLGIAFLIVWLLNRLFGLFLRRILPRVFDLTQESRKLVLRAVRPLSILVVLLLFREFALPSLLLPSELGRYIGILMHILIPLSGVVFVYQLVNVANAILQRAVQHTETTLDDQLLPLLTKTAKVAVVVIGGIFVLQNLDINVTALLAGVSIGGLALALAAQDTAKNFFGSISILVDRPFQVGDFIDIGGGVMGVVVEVGVRSTRIRALDGAQVSVPNGDLVNRTITNHGVRTYRRYATNITVTYSTTPDLMEKFLDGIRKILLEHPKSQDDSVTVYFHEMDNSSLNIFFAAIYDVTDYGEWLKCRQEVFLAVMRYAKEIGIEFAFPSTSVYIEQMPDGNLPEAYPGQPVNPGGSVPYKTTPTTEEGLTDTRDDED